MADLEFLICVSFARHACSSSVDRFKAEIARFFCVEHSMEVSGSFDLIYQGRCSSMGEYTEHLKQVSLVGSECLARLEINFVSLRNNQARDRVASGVWVHLGDEQGCDAGSIDKVVAEGDYMRVHVGNRNFLVHRTMRDFRELLNKESFVQLHRSCLVRRNFIERLVNRGGRWEARLRDRTCVRIARGRVTQVLELTTEAPSATNECSRKRRPRVIDVRPSALV